MNNLMHESALMSVTLERPMGMFPEKAPREQDRRNFPGCIHETHPPVSWEMCSGVIACYSSCIVRS